MNVTPLPADDAILPELLFNGWEGYNSGGEERKPGHHVSSLITDIMDKTGMFKPTPIDDMAKLRMMMGFVWEDIIGDYLSIRANEINQLPLCMDGIYGTPDALNLDENQEEGGLLLEFKATWKSEDKAIRDSWRWMTQIKSYLYMLGMTKAKLRILHVNYYPRTRTYMLDFTWQEVAETWQMLLNHKAALEMKSG